jgi:hypothetical protein
MGEEEAGSTQRMRVVDQQGAWQPGIASATCRAPVKDDRGV